ncbi:S9 family peptidase [Streptomyces sp. WMMC1477]|uniref:S9 family peptidase n=1 Tax=Streptomyces sp. WMMC1477 TaxID=3015155 RepID=UPI0022B62229|nr:prolyl oligopeptidase family serine peptidase [Streptomyces sp. WMMC1477]MCZ7434355.1 prolyl oligopeptidase family serine peptidase [Streptomyces sp. WMMC1477]
MLTAPYGTWPSPLDARTVAAHDGRPEFLGAVGGELWWTAPRPEEGGRRALLRLPAPDAAGGDDPGTPRSVLPPPWDVRNRVLEYGGLPWAAAARATGGPLLVFCHQGDQRLYAHEPDVPGAGPRPLTPLGSRGEGLRWADPEVHLDRGEVWCVLEEFTGERPTDVRRVPVAVPLDGSAADDRSRVRELAPAQHDFVTGPKLSPDGRQAVWLAWDHPNMPWDGTELRCAEVAADGCLTAARTVLGGRAESVVQADWAADGTLLAVSDASGWWNLCRVDPRGGDAVGLCPRAEEFGDGLWKLGLRWFAPLADGTVAVLHGRGAKRLGVLDPHTGDLVDAVGSWTEWAPTLAVDGTRVVGVGAGARSGYEIVELDTATGHSRVLAERHADAVDPAYYPHPVERTFTGPDGREVHAHVYPPANPRARGPEGEAPPYVIWVHGGPTSRVPLVLDLEIAYFTSRGIGVAEVNYGGSTGYGRAYRERLRGGWGVVDVADCATVALGLAEEGSADRARLAIRGGSAGGWTTAVSLTSPAAAGVYACGTISFPILEPEGWSGDDTHDFESRYLEGLIGDPERDAERYRERSPARNAHRMTAPFLLLQGLDDVICPPAQCERFLDALAAAGGTPVPHTYLTFEGEAHGFRRADTIARAVEAELDLYLDVFGAPVTTPEPA